MAANSEVRLTTNDGHAAPSWRRRLWRYGPLGLWLAFIFFASTGALSAANTSRIIEPPCQRTVSMAMAKSKGPAKAVMAVAAEIVTIVGEMAGSGMWRPGASE